MHVDRPYQATVTPRDKSDGQVKLQVLVSAREGNKTKKKLSTTVTLKLGRFQLFGGWTLEGGDVLIMAVSAK